MTSKKLTIQEIGYSIGEKKYTSILHTPTTSDGPLIVLYPTWMGLVDTIYTQLDHYITLGYQLLLVDLYSEKKALQSKEQAEKEMTALLKDEKHFSQVISNPIEIAKTYSKKVVAIGYCFGGLCVLELAKMGTELEAVISIHGLFKSPIGTYQVSEHNFQTQLFFLCGGKDPYLPEEDLLCLVKELKEKNTSWRMITYHEAMHGYTNPKAQHPESGILYNEKASLETQREVKNFLASIH